MGCRDTFLLLSQMAYRHRIASALRLWISAQHLSRYPLALVRGADPQGFRCAFYQMEKGGEAMEVDFDTKVGELLDRYPFLEEELIRINPRFKKLKNPILRRTVARIATLAQAARVGGMDPLELVNKIRALLGQLPLEGERTKNEADEPAWIAKEPKVILYANELLDEGKNPLAEVSKTLKELQPGDLILIKSDFCPQPLVEEMQKRGHEAYCKEDKEFFTFILKGS